MEGDFEYRWDVTLIWPTSQTCAIITPVLSEYLQFETTLPYLEGDLYSEVGL